LQVFFSWETHSLQALPILIFSWRIGNKITHELWACAQRGCILFFRPMRNSILENLGSTGDQSRIKCPRFFNQRRGRSQNVTAASTGLPVGVLKALMSFYERGEDSAFESDRRRVNFDFSKQSREAAVKTTICARH